MSSSARNYSNLQPSSMSGSPNNLGLQSVPFSNMPKYFPTQNQPRFDHRTQPQPPSTNFPMQMGDSSWSPSYIPSSQGGYQQQQQSSSSSPWSTMGKLPQAQQPLNQMTHQYHHPPDSLPMTNTNVNWQTMNHNNIINNSGMPGYQGNCQTRHNRNVLPSPMPGMSSDSQMSYGGGQYQYRPMTRGMGSQMTNYQQQQQQQQQQQRIHSSGQLQMTPAGSQMRNFQNNSQMTSMSSGQPLTSTQMQAAQMAGEFMSSNPGQVRQMGQQHQRQQSQPQQQQQQQQHQQNFPVPQTIRVGVPPPGGVLEPQTIRVTAPTPQPIQQELPTPTIALGRGGQNYSNYNPNNGGRDQAAMMVSQQQQQGYNGQADDGAGGTMDDGKGGKVKYIPMSWGELLGGGKDNNSLDGLKVIMAAPPGADAANQNRQLRVAFGNQPVVAQPGEVPLKVVSINPVDGYQMGPVAGLNDGEQQSQGQGQHQQLQNMQASPNRSRSLTNPITPGAGHLQTNRRSPSNVMMMSPNNPMRHQSPMMYPGSSNNSSMSRRGVDFAGTKYY